MSIVDYSKIFYENIYNDIKPYPHLIFNNVIHNNFALKCQEEILNIQDEKWDRYNNPFEQKYTLRDKNNLPENCNKLFTELTSSHFVNKLSSLIGENLINDPNKNWWGIHKYDNGDHLDIHSDAGIHPITKQKKHITLGIYLSKNWTEENGGHLEFWSGDSVISENPKLYKLENKTLPSFNKMIIFNNTNNAWHGNPIPVKCLNDEKRIFVTLSYLSENHTKPYDNYFQKAYFIKRPEDEDDPEKDKLRRLRVDATKYKDTYNLKK